MSTDKRARQKANRASRVAAAEEAARRARVRSRILRFGVMAVVIVGVIVLVAVLLDDDGDDTTADRVLTPDPADATSTTSSLPPLEEGECPATDGSSPRRIDFAGPQPDCIDPTKSYTAVFDTSEGEVVVELDTETTPNTVNNFVTLARWGYYDGTTLFRTDPSIDIIQGGSPHTESASDPGPGYTIPDEGGPYTYVPGQLVMARSAGPDSSSAQFFFTTGPDSSLLDAQGTYLVFGETDAAGLEVLQGIIGLHEDDPTSPLGGGPSRTITINSVTILES